MVPDHEIYEGLGNTNPWRPVSKCPHCLVLIHVSAEVAISKSYAVVLKSPETKEKVGKWVGQTVSSLKMNRGTGRNYLNENVKKQARNIKVPNRGPHQKGPS